MLGIYLSMLNSAADQEAFQALYECSCTVEKHKAKQG